MQCLLVGGIFQGNPTAIDCDSGEGFERWRLLIVVPNLGIVDSRGRRRRMSSPRGLTNFWEVTDLRMLIYDHDIFENASIGLILLCLIVVECE